MITLEHPITVSLFGRTREISEVKVVNISIDFNLKKTIVSIENVPNDKREFMYAERLTLWAGEKAIDAPTPDPKEGSYFADADTSQTGIENRIKEILNLRA